MPDFELEDRFDTEVCGIDEVGRGPLAGPVVSACVIIPKNMRSSDFVKDIRDSKKLSKTKREQLSDLIMSNFPCGICEVSVDVIDEVNILQASLLAMGKSYQNMLSSADGIKGRPAAALIDGNKAPDLPCPAITVIKGDSKSYSIAAASIVAKVYRDGIMSKLSTLYPQYGWERNSGYRARQHLHALEKFGITPHHRKTYAPVRRYIETSSPKTARS